MKELLGSRTKEHILLYLGLRGGVSGRRLARVLKKSPTPIFKALRQLERAKVIVKNGPPSFYSLNPHYSYYDELIAMIHKKGEKLKNRRPYLPKIADDRRVDPFAVYEMLSLIGPGPRIPRLSDTLRKRHAG